MLNWKKRIGNWAAHVRKQHGSVSWANMALALLSGPVPADVWRARIRVCARCPVRSPGGWVCRRELENGVGIGCNCDLVFKALTAAPYPRGCWAYQVTGGVEGWPAHHFPTRWAKIRAVWRFVFNTK